MITEKVSSNLAIDLAPQHPLHLLLKNPVIIASGTFGSDGYGNAISPDLAVGSLGAVVPKTVTRRKRDGNRPPRKSPEEFSISGSDSETRFLNSFGLNNPGIEAVLRDEAPKWSDSDGTFILSISARSEPEFKEMAQLTRGIRGFNAVELNLSCPNVDDDVLFSYCPDLTEKAVAAVKECVEVPVLVKLAPNVPDIAPIAKAAERAGADALTISNTLPAMRINVNSYQPQLGNVTGGLSGPSLHPVAVALVYRASKAVGVPIIGVGGVFCAQDALEFILAGASAVQVGSANLVDPWAPFKILEGIQSYLGERGIADINELIGAVED